MKAKVLNEGFNRAGQSVIAIWTNPKTIYQRKNGSFYIKNNSGKRFDVQRRPDGSFYLATHEWPE